MLLLTALSSVRLIEIFDVLHYTIRDTLVTLQTGLITAIWAVAGIITSLAVNDASYVLSPSINFTRNWFNNIVPLYRTSHSKDCIPIHWWLISISEKFGPIVCSNAMELRMWAYILNVAVPCTHALPHLLQFNLGKLRESLRNVCVWENLFSDHLILYQISFRKGTPQTLEAVISR